MAKYEVTAPDGHVYHLEGPEGASLEQLQAEIKRAYPEVAKATAGSTFSKGPNLQAQAAAPKPAEHTFMGDLGTSTVNVLAGLAQGVASIPDITTNALAGAGRVVAGGGAKVGSAVYNALGMHDQAQAVQRNAATIDRGLARPFTIGGAIENVAPTPQDTTGKVIRFASQMAGGAMVPVGPKVTPPAKMPAPATMGARAQRAAAMQAADRQGITMLPPDVGGTGTRMAAGITSRTLGGVPMAEAADKSLATAAAARDRVAANMGRIADDTGAGQAAQRGAKAFIRSSEERGGQLYERIPIPNGKLVTTKNTRAALIEMNKGLESNPYLSKLWAENPKLQATAEALARTVNPDGSINWEGAGRLSWKDLKAFRSIVGNIVGRPGLDADGNTLQALKGLYGSLSSDMEAAAASQGPRALTAFRRANQYWRGRETRISDVLSNVLGHDLNKGEASAFEQINRWAQAKGGDFQRLSRMIRSMPEDEASTVRATIVSRMGQASPGRQNADGLAFSPAEFATQWAKMSNRAKSVLFPNPAHRADLNDLALVMNNMKRAGEYSNFSNTSLGTNAVAHVMGLFSSPATAMGLAGMEFGAGKLLSSPAFARWLARAPKDAAPGAMRAYINRLPQIAATNPGIRDDVTKLFTAMNENLATAGRGLPGKAAADENVRDSRRTPPQ